MPFVVCYYHVIWSTKGRQPLILPSIETLILETVQRKSVALNSPIHAINAVEDHVHIAVSIAPSIAVAEWVRSVKGVSAHDVNDIFPDVPTRFQWQKSYGVLTFGARNLPFVVDYILRQKEHHQQKTTMAYLEDDGENE